MAEPMTITIVDEHDEAGWLKRENAQLKAYLRAFVRATYSHPRDCYGGQTPAQDATSMHRVNSGMTYSFGLNELEGDDPVITGGQVMRAMELLGEAPELTPAEEAANLQAAAMLRDVQNTIAMAVEAIAGRQGEPSTPEMLERLAAAGSPAEARARYLAGALVHLKNMAEGIPAVLKRTPNEHGEPVAWAYECLDVDVWVPRLALDEPKPRAWVHNIRPLYAAPAPSRPADREAMPHTLQSGEGGTFLQSEAGQLFICANIASVRRCLTAIGVRPSPNPTDGTQDMDQRGGP